MKLMGALRLEALADCGDDDLVGRAAALRAELAAADWEEVAAVAQAFPLAEVDGRHFKIPIGAAHCVLLCVHCEARMVLVEYAGPTGSAAASGRTGGRRGR